MHQDVIERRTREIGLDIFALARSAEPGVLNPEWWLGKLLDWATSAPQRKLQMFRFIDVLPALGTDEEVAHHLAVYLLKEDVPLPWVFRRALRAAADGAWFRAPLASATRASSLRMAQRFIAGHNPREALETIHALRYRHMGFTLDLLGEAVTSESQADEYAQSCIDLLQAIAPTVRSWPTDPRIDECATGELPRLNLSVKLSSLDPNFDAIDPARTTQTVLARLRPILRCARSLNGYVHIDMEQYEYRDLTLHLFEEVFTEPEFRDWSNCGIVLQAYLRDAEADLDRLLAWVKRRGTPITVRLVKGAYWDYETFMAIQNHWPIPVWTRKWESDATFERMARRLIDNRVITRPALASHNVRSLAAAIAYAEHVGARPRDFEVQMLFGMGDPLKKAIVDMGYALRVYTPFGDLIPGMAYLIRRLLENTSNESFLKHSVSASESPEALLADPAEARPPSAPVPQPVIVDPDEETPMKPFEGEPHTDFSRASAREAMQLALNNVRTKLGATYPLVIDGKRIETKELLASENPANTSEIIGRVCCGGKEHVEQAVRAARAAFADWSALSARERGDYLRRLASLMRRDRFELCAWIVLEVGKPWREADGDVGEAIDFCEFYAREMERLETRPRRRNFPGEENVYLYQPRGVTAVIAPWNFPLAILAGMATAAMAAGNTVVMKPAEQSSVIAAHLMRLIEEAGVPAGVVNLLPGRGEVVGAGLVSHPDVNLIVFTGSREVGVAIYAEAGRWQPGQQSLKRVIAEMGGKNAIIVDADADLDEAVAGVVGSIFGYAGQKCSACSRVIVVEPVREAFVGRLIETTKSVRIGPPEDPANFVGPVIDATSRDRILRYIEAGRRDGQLVFQAELGNLASQGYFVPPTIFDGVPPKAAIAQEEIFGPVVAILSAKSFDEALEIANGAPYALTGGVFSRDLSHVELAKRRFNVGNLYINRGITGALVDRQPFGGFKMSGIGSKAGGPDYLLQFLEPKAITENTLRHGFAPESTGVV